MFLTLYFALHIVHHKGTGKLTYRSNQLTGTYIIDKHTGYSVNHNCNNFYLFATSAYTLNHLPPSHEFSFEAFCVWFIFDRVQRWVVPKPKVFVSYFKPKPQQSLEDYLNFNHKNGIFLSLE